MKKTVIIALAVSVAMLVFAGCNEEAPVEINKDVVTTPAELPADKPENEAIATPNEDITTPNEVTTTPNEITVTPNEITVTPNEITSSPSELPKKTPEEPIFELVADGDKDINVYSAEVTTTLKAKVTGTDKSADFQWFRVDENDKIIDEKQNGGIPLSMGNYLEVGPIPNEEMLHTRYYRCNAMIDNTLKSITFSVTLCPMGVEVEETTLLEALKAKIANSGCSVGVAYLGYHEEKYEAVFDYFEKLGIYDVIPAISEMNVDQIAATQGDDLFLIVSTDGYKSSITAHDVEIKGGSVSAGYKFYGVYDGDPMILNCRKGEDLPNACAVITDANGKSLTFVPTINESGKLVLPQGVCDLTPYDLINNYVPEKTVDLEYLYGVWNIPSDTNDIYLEFLPNNTVSLSLLKGEEMQRLDGTWSEKDLALDIKLYESYAEKDPSNPGTPALSGRYAIFHNGSLLRLTILEGDPLFELMKEQQYADFIFYSKS